MPLDATYDQLMRVLSSRGLEWLRQHVMDLPDPLPADHPALGALALGARIAPVLSGLRGCPSPLEDIVTRRLARPHVRQAAGALLDGDDRTDQAVLVGAGHLIAGDDPVWQLACLALAGDPRIDLLDRLAATGKPDAATTAEAEAIICDPIPEEMLNEERTDRFMRTLMQLYCHGAHRPQFSHPRIYGDAFAKLLRIADWARNNGQVTSMAQAAYCLRLIDPDHDITSLLAEIISNQRPDGSFPRKAGYSTQDQDLDSGVWPTLMALAALNLAAWRRWRGPHPQVAPARPFTACRDFFTTTLTERFAVWATQGPKDQRLMLAACMSRATGENWFLRAGLRRAEPGREVLLTLARQAFTDPYTAHHARNTLNVDRHWPHDLESGEHGPALRWLRGAAVTIQRRQPPDPRNIDLACPEGFNRYCREALGCPPGTASIALRLAACRHARRALVALERQDRLSPEEALEHLDRLCLMAQLFEGDAAQTAAA
ncbi:hypothetical protein [Paracoccus marinaquae]|uniref:Uncharacterized protein n=1 Tax=Paracoccus marinaquae TaxID=2841926 RepID=A0ABS6AK58_9RHOB|nr:hypothetical protein [Paracoccus marinaquae]MBU3030977.1 hypothetical protein [Paracoccus marinaquae]